MGLCGQVSIDIVRIENQLYRFFFSESKNLENRVDKVVETEGVMERITEFRRYPFRVNEKITIADGPRKGDWEVVGVDEKQVRLRCPVSGVEVRWARFCYQSASVEKPWPTDTDD